MRIPSGTTDQYKCATCGATKSRDCFGSDKRNARGLKYSCKDCINAKRRGAYQKENRKYHLKSTYGITPEQYDDLSVQQGGVCAVCKEPSEKKLYVDHDHVSGDVRGLLCHKCNVAIGLLFDDPTRLERAAKYIRGLRCVLKAA
jgi:hypothetical protein